MLPVIETTDPPRGPGFPPRGFAAGARPTPRRTRGNAGGFPARAASLAALGVILAVAARPAAAQIINRDFPESLPGYESDLTLPTQHYDPHLDRSRGTEFGDFIVLPSMSENAGYNSNPLGNATGGSSLLETSASLRVTSDWRRDALAASLTVDDFHYFDQPVASQTPWTASIGGGLDFLGSRWDLGYSHLSQYLGPQQLGTAGVTAPVPYDDDDVRFDDNLVFGRVRLVPAFEYSNYSFGQAPGEPRAAYASLDRQIVSPTLTGLFEVSKGRSLVALVRYTSARYRTPTPGSPDNDYDDILGFTGIDFQADAVVRIKALIGGESRTFASPFIRTKTTPTAELDVIWQPSRLTQLTTSFSRRFIDAGSVYAGSASVTDGRVDVDHELRRNVELTAFADVGASTFASGPRLGSNTSQLQESFGASAIWTLSRHVRLTLAYQYLNNAYDTQVTRSLPVLLPTITTHVVTLGFGLSD